jgi:predicted nucleic acid-binding protein
MRKIHLDTNYLIEIHVEKSKSRAVLKSLLKEKVEFAISTITWHEFLCGPLEREQKDNIIDLVQNRIVPLTSEMAEVGSELFNLIGRKKGMKADCLIAATSICENSEILSWNADDFKKFKPFGLLLL